MVLPMMTFADEFLHQPLLLGGEAIRRVMHTKPKQYDVLDLNHRCAAQATSATVVIRMCYKSLKKMANLGGCNCCTSSV